MKTTLGIVGALLLAGALAVGQNAKPAYTNDFEGGEIGKLPAEFLALDGAFAIQQDGTNKFLELPGSPLDSYGVLFGPTLKEPAQVTARIFGTAKGRRYPSFALGVNGVGGYRLQVAPAKQALELYRGDNLKTSTPFSWAPGKWLMLKVRVSKADSQWKIEGKVWPQTEKEPDAWSITAQDTEELPPGRAGIFGSPFAGTPIRYDDFVVELLSK